MESKKYTNTRDLISTITTIFEKMGVDIEGIVEDERSDIGVDRWVAIQSPDSAILIGPNGEHLSALNHYIRQFLYPSQEFCIIDVNQYYKSHLDKLKETSRLVADEVMTGKGEVEMEPMTPLERRCVHSFLLSYPTITTESRGDGDERRIVAFYQEK